MLRKPLFCLAFFAAFIVIRFHCTIISPGIALGCQAKAVLTANTPVLKIVKINKILFMIV